MTQSANQKAAFQKMLAAKGKGKPTTTQPAMKEVNKKPEMGPMPNKAEMAMMAKGTAKPVVKPTKGGKKAKGK